jgi:hypothetical protein
MKNYHIEDGVLYYVNPETTGKFVIPEGVKEIAEKAFSGCRSITSIEIPNTVTKIGRIAFQDCSSLEAAIIPDSVTELGEGAYTRCSKLSRVKLSSNIKTLEYATFAHCSGLKTVSNMQGLEAIGSKAFFNSGIENITLPKSLKTLSDNAFYGTKLKRVVFNGNVEDVAPQAFVGANGIEELEFNFNGKKVGVVRPQTNKSRLPILRKSLSLTVVPNGEDEGYKVYTGNEDIRVADSFYNVNSKGIEKFAKQGANFDYKTRTSVPTYISVR